MSSKWFVNKFVDNFQANFDWKRKRPSQLTRSFSFFQFSPFFEKLIQTFLCIYQALFGLPLLFHGPEKHLDHKGGHYIRLFRFQEAPWLPRFPQYAVFAGVQLFLLLYQFCNLFFLQLHLKCLAFILLFKCLDFCLLLFLL